MEPSDGKEGVDGSSPSEGSGKGQQMASFLRRIRQPAVRAPKRHVH